MPTEILTIAQRFHGPPDSGNGGYVCGRLAQHVDAPAVAVRLRIPPPLDTALTVGLEDGRARLMQGEEKVAEAWPIDLDIEPPTPPEFGEVLAASEQYRGFESHWYPSCFVCGPKRQPGDGLCIFAGPVAGRELVAAPWIPESSLAGEDGMVAPEFVWAALDCPGGFSFPEPAQGAILLGEMQAQIVEPVPVSGRYTVIGWEREQDGRKHHTATALFDETGRCHAMAKAIWFEVKEPA